MQVLKDLTLGTDISRPYVTTLTFEGGEIFSVVFWLMNSLRLHRSDTAINSYGARRLEVRTAKVSSIVQSKRFGKFEFY